MLRIYCEFMLRDVLKSEGRNNGKVSAGMSMASSEDESTTTTATVQVQVTASKNEEAEALSSAM